MPSTLTPDELAATDLAVGWPVADVPQAVAIEEAESSGNPSIVGWETASGEVDTNLPTIESAPFSEYATGLFQDLSSHNPDKGAKQSVADPKWLAQMENPVANSAEALQLFDGSRGWSPWDTDEAISGTAAEKASLLAAGTKATNDVAGTPANETSWITWVEHNLNNDLPIPAGVQAVGGAVGGAVSLLSGGWQKVAFELAAGAAGAALIILGLYRAAPKSDDEHGSLVGKAALAAAA